MSCVRYMWSGLRLQARSRWVRGSNGFHAGSAYLDTHEDDDGNESDNSQMMIPWVRSVISGVGIMRHPKYNKGAPFVWKIGREQ
jgi:hypothetical protein